MNGLWPSMFLRAGGRVGRLPAASGLVALLSLPLAAQAAAPAQGEGAAPRLVERWRTRVESPVSLPLASDGERLFAVVEAGAVVALDKAGRVVWRVALPAPVTNTQPREYFSTPPVVVSSVLVVGSDQGWLRAYDPATGAPRWRQQVGRDLLGAPARCSGPTGEVCVAVVARNEGAVSLLSVADGRRLWESKPVGRCDCPLVVQEGRIIYGACDAAIHVVDARGGETLAKLSLAEHGPVAAGVAVAGDDVYVGTRDGSVARVDLRKGMVRWVTACGKGEMFTTPCRVRESVAAGSGEGVLFALETSSGKVLWSVPAGNGLSSPVLCGSGLVTTAAGSLQVWEPSSGRLVQGLPLADSLSPPVVVDDGVVVGSDDGFVIFFGKAGGHE